MDLNIIIFELHNGEAYNIEQTENYLTCRIYSLSVTNNDNLEFIIFYSSSINIGIKFENNIDNLYLDKIIKKLYSFEYDL